MARRIQRQNRRFTDRLPADRRAAVVAFVAVASTLMAGFAAMTIDLGNLYIARTELQRAADAAALAAASKLTHYQAGLSERMAEDAARDIVEANPVQGRRVTIDLARDVDFGHAVFDSGRQRYDYTSGGVVHTAVKVTVRLSADSPNGPVNLMFAGIWGSRNKDMNASAAAMIVPRDIAVVADLSGSMNDDSELQNYRQTNVNLWNIWVCLPIEKGNNGVGNGIDPPPPGNPPINDDYGTGPGNPGNRGGANPKLDPALMGPTWGRMITWGRFTWEPGYDPRNDPGLIYLPESSWSGSAYSELQSWLRQVGYSNAEVSALTSDPDDGYSGWKYRVAVALGLARWDSGKDGGLWSKLAGGRGNSRGNNRGRGAGGGHSQNTQGNGDDRVSSGELIWLVDYPFDRGSWLEYIDNYMPASNSYMASSDRDWRYRFGLKTFVNYLLEQRPSYAETPQLALTPEQPLQAVKDAVEYCMDLIADQESDDQVSIEIFGETAHHMNNLTKKYSRISDTLDEMQASHYDGWTNTGGGIDLAIDELTSKRARSNAAKVCFLLSDGQANVSKWGHAGDSSKGKEYALDKAQEAVDKGIQFYCVSVGVGADRPFMQDIAEMGGGEEFYAAGTIDEYSVQLKNIFAELGSRRPVRLIE